MRKNRRYLIAMLDGFGLDYYETPNMPELKKLASEGLFKPGRAPYADQRQQPFHSLRSMARSTRCDHQLLSR